MSDEDAPGVAAAEPPASGLENLLAAGRARPRVGPPARARRRRVRDVRRARRGRQQRHPHLPRAVRRLRTSPAGKDTHGAAKPGWWDVMVGPGKAIDTDRYFVICSNVLGGCSGTTGPGSHRPDHRDALRACASRSSPSRTWSTCRRAARPPRRRTGSLAVVGGSMGGMQALAWATRYPGARADVRRRRDDAAPRRAGDRLQRGRPPGDPRRPALRRRRLLRRRAARARALASRAWSATSRTCPTSRCERSSADGCATATTTRSTSCTEFEVESYLAYQGQQVRRALRREHVPVHDEGDGLLRPGRRVTTPSPTRLRGTPARFLVLSFSSDWLFPTYQTKGLVDALRRAKGDGQLRRDPQPLRPRRVPARARGAATLHRAVPRARARRGARGRVGSRGGGGVR